MRAEYSVRCAAQHPLSEFQCRVTLGEGVLPGGGRPSGPSGRKGRLAGLSSRNSGNGPPNGRQLDTGADRLLRKNAARPDVAFRYQHLFGISHADPATQRDQLRHSAVAIMEFHTIGNTSIPLVIDVMRRVGRGYAETHPPAAVSWTTRRPGLLRPGNPPPRGPPLCAISVRFLPVPTPYEEGLAWNRKPLVRTGSSRKFSHRGERESFSPSSAEVSGHDSRGAPPAPVRRALPAPRTTAGPARRSCRGSGA